MIGSAFFTGVNGIPFETSAITFIALAVVTVGVLLFGVRKIRGMLRA